MTWNNNWCLISIYYTCMHTHHFQLVISFLWNTDKVIASMHYVTWQSGPFDVQTAVVIHLNHQASCLSVCIVIRVFGLKMCSWIHTKNLHNQSVNLANLFVLEAQFPISLVISLTHMDHIENPKNMSMGIFIVI